MADISKITIETGTYDIKDEVARNQLSPLSRLINKKYILIGDSYLTGYTPNGNITNWGIYFQQFLGIANDKIQIVGYNTSGFTRIDVKTFTQMISELTDDDEVTDIIVCGGYNDIGSSNSSLLSYMTSFKTACASKFPNAKISVGHIGWTTDPANIYPLSLNIAHYKSCCAELGFTYLSNVEYSLKDYFGMFTNDKIHPNATGQVAIAKAITSAVVTGQANIYYDFRNISFTPASNITITSPGNFATVVNNNVTSIILAEIMNLGLSNAITLNCDNTPFEIGTITNGYAIGNTYNLIQMPVTVVIGYSGGYATITGSLSINNGKLYLTLYNTNEYNTATNFGAFTGTYLIQIKGCSISFDSSLC